MLRRWTTFILLLWFVASMSDAVIGSGAGEWRSHLYPEDWTPCTIDSAGRFLQDYSFAGYHAGMRPIPDDPTDLVVDVTEAPYFADPSGKQDATEAIQQAIDFVGAAGGGTVYLPPGHFIIKAPEDRRYALGIRHDHVRLFGAGPDETFIQLVGETMRDKDVIRVYGEGDWRHASGVQRISEPLTYPTQIIPLEAEPRFNIGDWVVLTHDSTSEWIFEHNMGDLWREGSIPGATMYRQVIDVDREAWTITIDAPIRYYLLPRDDARVYRVGRHVEEVGIGHFSIGMTEHPGTGWGSNDYTFAGTAAYDVHHSHAIRLIHTVNSWIQNVKSFRPDGNGRPHLLSNGILVRHSRFITIDSVDLREPQYRGGGGNGYHFTLIGNDSLIVNSAAYNGRHNYDFKQAYANGNVISRSYAYSPDGLNSDFHMHLSPSNLIDHVLLDQDRFDAGWRGQSGTTPHAHSSTHAVFWNIIGERYKGAYREIVYSEQYGHGYVIGTQGPAHGVRLGTNARTLPEDYAEGIGKGDTLFPQSLYEDQLAKRVARSGVIHCPELDFRPPVPRVTMIAPDDGERVKGVIPVLVDVQAPLKGIDITDVTVSVDDTTIYRGSVIPSELSIDTNVLPDGRHRWYVKAQASNGLSTEISRMFHVANTWTFVDDLDAPIESGWFGVLSRERTVELSDGWDYDTSDPERFFGDVSRRVRVQDTDEYLIWEADALERVVLTVYTSDVQASGLMELAVLENGMWKEVEFAVDEVQSSESNLFKMVLTGNVEKDIRSERLRLKVFSSEDGDFDQGDPIQIGKLSLYGRNL